MTRVSSTDVHTTSYVLQHTRQPDHYCFEKLLLTPSDQFARGAAWHWKQQRLVDGFETIFAFQFGNAAQLCKKVKELVYGVTLYEHCALTGSDGFAFVLRGGDEVAALGRGGGSLGYGGLMSSLAIEFDTWANDDMGDVVYNHVAVQAGGPGRHGAAKEAKDAGNGKHQTQVQNTVLRSPQSPSFPPNECSMHQINGVPKYPAVNFQSGPASAQRSSKISLPRGTAETQASTTCAGVKALYWTRGEWQTN